MPAGDLVTADYTLEIGGVLLGSGTVYDISYDRGGIAGLGAPQAKTNDVGLAHAEGVYAGRSYPSERLITIPFSIAGATPTATGDAYLILADLFEPTSTAAVEPLYVQLPGFGKFYVTGQPRGFLREDIRNLQYGQVEAEVIFVCPDPTITYIP